MNTAYWFLLVPIVALDSYISVEEVQKWFPYVYEFPLCQTRTTLTLR